MLLGRKKKKKENTSDKGKTLKSTNLHRRLSILARERRTSHLHRNHKILDAQFRGVVDGYANTLSYSFQISVLDYASSETTITTFVLYLP